MAELPDTEHYNRDITEALISHPGWDEFLKILEKQVRALKLQMIVKQHDSMEAFALDQTGCRGGLAALNTVLRETYKQAKLDVPADVKHYFE